MHPHKDDPPLPVGQGISEIMEVVNLIGTIVYFVVLVTLACYGLHRYVIIYLYYRYRKQAPQPKGRLAVLPKVTVQLPLYNEMYVAERLLDAVAALDYPKDKLEIQILDDSTDGTTGILARKVDGIRAQGFQIVHIHRDNRHGYKAGALQHGLQTATGEFIAIFDADFVPTPDFLQRTIQYFTDPGIGMVQTRWGHLNDRYSLLTRLQSIIVDGHFLIEQTARAHSGRFFNFNGTAGIWRRDAIEDAEGWHGDTLAEDLDLSYRAQMKGWRFVFLPDVVTPAELPPDMDAFKTQQHRWAKGSVQACKKLLPSVWRSDIPLKIKFEATVHLTSNFGHLLLFVLCIVFHATASAGTNQVTGGNQWTKLLLVDVPLFFAATVSISAFYFCAQKQLHARWWKRILYIPLLMAVGIGLCINNARAVLEAIFNQQSEFVRTPKYGVCDRAGMGKKRTRSTFRGLVPCLELLFGFYFTLLMYEAVELHQWTVLPFIGVIQVGFFYVGVASLWLTISTQLKRNRPDELLPAGANA